LFADVNGINSSDGGESLSALYTGTSAFSIQVKGPSLIIGYQYDSKPPPFLPLYHSSESLTPEVKWLFALIATYCLGTHHVSTSMNLKLMA
jgi:hypothetical protein